MSFDQNKYDYYKAFLDVEKDDAPLDEASRKQPVLRQEVAEEQNRAHAEMLKAAAVLKPTEAFLNIDWRAKLDAKGEKFTEKKIESLVEDDPRLADAVKAHIEAKANYIAWNSLYESYEAREKTIDNQIRLAQAGFISFRRSNNT